MSLSSYIPVNQMDWKKKACSLKRCSKFKNMEESAKVKIKKINRRRRPREHKQKNQMIKKFHIGKNEAEGQENREKGQVPMKTLPAVLMRSCAIFCFQKMILKPLWK